MKNIKGIWLPDGEVHLQGFADKENWTYQGRKFQEALSHVTNFKTAIDVGGHCGLWSMQMAPHFERVVAFEPVPVHRECFVKNCPTVELIPYALGDKEEEVKLHWKPESTGGTRISQEGTIKAQTKILDSYNFQDVGFIKIDTEGYELLILRGAEDTIKRCHPVVIVEQKPGMAEKFGLQTKGAVTFLEKRGYQLKKVISGDYILA